jgi:hypothetical protein
MKYYLCMLALLLGLTLTAHPQYDKKERETGKKETGQNISPQYRWPLNINNGYSSSFQEFRSNHFHAGMDLRTNQRTGYPVHALADGRIIKIRMVKRGSGRGLYLKHDDGNTSIYFHLDRFEKKLEALLVRVQRLKGQKYFGNYYLKKPLRYKRGQVIGYSGETGSGFPHLHLEIRNPDQVALNPFKLVKLPSREYNSPVLRRVLFRNRGSNPINGKIGEQFVNFKKTGAGRYVSTRPLVITGPFDVVLNANDVSDSGRRVSPYEISVSIDEHFYYHLQFDRFQWDDNNQLGFVYDMYHSNSSSYYFNLFFQKGFFLEDKNILLPQVIDALGEGEHRLKIKLRDNFNNVSTGTVTFYKIKKPELQISDCVVTKNEITLEIEKLDAESADDITLGLKDKKGNRIYTGRLKDRLLQQKKEYSLKGSFDQIRFIDFKFFKKGIVYFKKRFTLQDQWLGGVTDIDFETFINRDEVFIKLADPAPAADNMRLTVIQGMVSQEIKAESDGDSVYFRFKPLNFENNVLLHFALLRDGETAAVIEKKLLLVHLKEGVNQDFKYEEFGAKFDTRAVYEPKVLLVEEKHYKSSFPILSRQVSLSPYHFPFLDKVFYTFRKNLAEPRQVGIFKYDPKYKKWSYRYTTYNSANQTYSRKVLSSGTYALMRDIYFPKIYFRKLKTKYRKNVKRLVVTITDKGKGVNDNTLKVHLNGSRIDCEYDPDWRTVVIENLRHIKTGKNLLKVEVKDYAGNKTQRTFSFYLK